MMRRRKELRVTQVELARACGVSAHTICDIEQGRCNPSVGVAEKVLGAMGLELKVGVKEL